MVDFVCVREEERKKKRRELRESDGGENFWEVEDGYTRHLFTNIAKCNSYYYQERKKKKM